MVWKVAGVAATAAAGAAANRALTVGWKAATGAEPPSNPEDPDTAWREAVAWAVVSGAVMGLARMLAARGTARYQRRAVGRVPEELGVRS